MTAWSLASCGDDVLPPEGPSNPDLVREARALVRVQEVPEGVRCLRVTVAGVFTMQFSLDVEAGKVTSLSAGGLPTGIVHFQAEAFESACASVTTSDIAEWRSAPQTQTLVAGTTAVLTLVLRRNGVAEVGFGFEFAKPCAPGANACSSDELCFVLACGDASGGCLKRPLTCSQQYDPVCGCDGVTYANACEAAAADRSVAHAGACSCGGPNAVACAAGYACTYSDGVCASPGQTGVCTAAPVACPSVSEPVCGCDGRTYANRCLAAAAGASVLQEGACAPIPCGGPVNAGCPASMFCSFADGTCADPARVGVCVERPRLCPTIQYAPVCACNGKQYTNVCLANAVGASVANRGPCVSP